MARWFTYHKRNFEKDHIIGMSLCQIINEENMQKISVA